MREVKEIKWIAAGGATYVADVCKCLDWTTCSFTGSHRHYHGTASLAGPNVPLLVAFESGHRVDDILVAMALNISLQAALEVSFQAALVGLS